LDTRIKSEISWIDIMRFKAIFCDILSDSVRELSRSDLEPTTELARKVQEE
jgi:hypothetical protein